MVIRILLIAVLVNVFMSATEAAKKPVRRTNYSFTEYLLTDRGQKVYHRMVYNKRGEKVRAAAVFRSRQDCQRFKQAYLTPTERRMWHCSGIDPD